MKAIDGFFPCPEIHVPSKAPPCLRASVVKNLVIRKKRPFAS